MIKINGKTITGDRFAFDGCHKIYIIDTPEEETQALKYGYNIYPIKEIEEAYNDSCSLKFISNWPLDDNFVSYANQCEEATFEVIDDEEVA
jgi:hypothetical protein